MLCFHVKPNAMPNGGFIAPVLGLCIVLYTLDACYVYFFMCEKIPVIESEVPSIESDEKSLLAGKSFEPKKVAPGLQWTP